MRYCFLLLIFGSLLVSAACRRGAPPAAAPSWSPVPAERVYYDNEGGIRDSVRLVVRDREALQRLWTQATAGQAAPPPPPQVDFGREMLLAVGAGRMTPEDQIQVDSVGVRPETTAAGRREDVLAVVVRTTEGCRRFNVDAYPVEIVRVRRFDGPVSFLERRVQATDC